MQVNPNIPASRIYGNLDLTGGSIYATSLSGRTIYSGSTPLETIIQSFSQAGSATYVQPGFNTYTAGTVNAPSVNISAVTLVTISGGTVSGGTFYSGSTNVENVIYSIERYKPYLEKNAQYFITSSDWTINCTANTFTIILPTAIGVRGKIYNVKNTGNGTIYLSGTSSQTIDDLLAQTASTKYSSFTVQSTGANWIII